ncbi:hypothetical protein [Methanobrevibacter sp. V14]|uniref:hypothetical protein n=1 Tax=Methanobrevibacter sp. V14 TaxID=3064280 RepID=UPI0027362B0D|nr:hypothetical protein [Methanobrevibacter sp. V14]
MVMKVRYVLAILILFTLIACVHGEKFTPESGTFAFREVEIFEINGINFTIPADYNITYENNTEMDFEHGKNKLNISVADNGTVEKVKKDMSKNITSGKTMLGSQKGYLVDKNGTYTFSYMKNDKLVVIKSENMPLMIGAMEGVK